MTRLVIGCFLGVAAFCFSGWAAEAQTMPPPEGWTFDAGLYGWLTATSGTIDVRGQQTSINSSFADLVQRSDSLIGIMGHAEAHKDQFSGILDFVYADIGYKPSTVGPFGAKATSKLTIIDATGAYRFGRWPLGLGSDTSFAVEGLAGLRYNSVGGSLDFQSAGGVQPPNVSQSKDWIDPIIGTRLSATLSESWAASLRGDIGGFGVGSDFTWQAALVISYSFKLFDADASADFGYRALSWRFSNGGGSQEFKWSANFHGPVIGLMFHF
jgi:hypothetical protein